MANKIITVIDLSDSLKEKIESFIIANILEKRCNKLAIIDLNPFMNKFIFFKEKEFTRKNGFLSAKCFDNTIVNLYEQESFDESKLYKYVLDLADKNDSLIIRANLLQDKMNNKYIDKSDEIVLFCDITENSTKEVINYFLKHNLANKKVRLFAYNYVDNLQNEKTYLNLLKIFRGQNIEIIRLASIPNYKTLKEIENIDPWDEIYKKINGAF